MKILIIVTYLYPRGGDSKHAFSVADGLRERGHEVFFFGMQDEKNLPALPGPLAPNIDFQEILRHKSLKNIVKALGSIYSFPARNAAAEFIAQHGPFDIAHVHSTHHQLSMSVLDVLKNNSIPFVWTLHDYKLICPNTTLFNEKSGRKCDSPGENVPFCVVKNRCKKKSILASLLSAIESGFNYLGGYYNYPEYYISPSEFLRELIISRNVTDRPVIAMPNYSPLEPEMKPELPGLNYLFIGRLTKGKGIDTLIRAFAESFHQISGKLVIVGSGDAESELRKLATDLIPENRYSFTGQLNSPNEIAQCYRNARCMILPSVWYENMPLSILESFSFARPVIASDIGGIPELVIDNETGLLFPAGSIDALSIALMKYSLDINKATEDGIAGWNLVRNKYTRANYICHLLELYEWTASRT